ncbi:MAG: transposase [Actinomycetota bacterium]|nr:transposase [Actinomycetota bacterium]
MDQPAVVHPDSWTAPMDARRISPNEDTTDATIDQVRRLVDLLPVDAEVPLFVFDAGYDPIAMAHGLADTRTQLLTRVRDDRVFYADPPARPRRPTGTGGRPPRHGRRTRCSDRRTWDKPTEHLETNDHRCGKVTFAAWAGLHPKLAGRGHWAGHDAPPIVKGTVVRVEVEHLPKPTARTKKTLWLFWSGPGVPDLDLCWRPTCGASTSSTPSASPRTPSGGRRRRCARPSRPSAGRGWSSGC